MKKVDKNALCVFGCYALWGVLPLFWKQLGAVNPVYVLACRILWSLICCFILLLVGGRVGEIKKILKDKRERSYLFLCGILITINWGSYIYAVNAEHVLDSSLAYFMNPILTIFIGFLVFREKLGKWQWISVGVAILGILIPVLMAGKFPWMAIVIGGSFSLYSLFKKKVTVDSSLSIFMETAFVAPFALVFIIVMETQGSGAVGVLSGWQWLLFPLAGVVTTIPLLLFAKGIKEVPMSLVGILMYVNPILQMLIGLVIFNEKLDVTRAITFLCIFVAIVLFSRGKKD